mmetsp:Transcript_144048/g.461084  ORF Transcript_144048/g.461084 Transcript_144048/m.461084 type:complete len:143 (+) Transcript_144048:280-708(+)
MITFRTCKTSASGGLTSSDRSMTSTRKNQSRSKHQQHKTTPCIQKMLLCCGLHLASEQTADPGSCAKTSPWLPFVLIGQLQKTETVLTGRHRQTDTAADKVIMREDSSKKCGLSDWCLAHWTGVVRVKPSLNALLMVDVQTR